MLVMMYHMLRDGVDYQELGHDYLDKLQFQCLTRYLVKQLDFLGHQVIYSTRLTAPPEGDFHSRSRCTREARARCSVSADHMGDVGQSEETTLGVADGMWTMEGFRA
jgi:hypothetical protein